MSFKNTKIILFVFLVAVVTLVGIPPISAELSVIQFWIEDDDPHFRTGEIYFHVMQDSGKMQPVTLTLYNPENEAIGEPLQGVILNEREYTLAFQILRSMEDGEYRIDLDIMGMTLSEEFLYIKD